MSIDFKCGNCVYYGDCSKEQSDICCYSESLEGDLVVDVCCGSGTTAVASKKSGRNYIVGDLEDKYLDITKKD